MDFLAHIFLPSPRNNFRAKAIQPSGIFLIAIVFLLLYALRVSTHVSNILGYTADKLPVENIVDATNKKRAEMGLPTLKVDEKLSQAAHKKGEDMLAHDYWAHVAPDGTTPWYFFDQAGYSFRYAGENLARDFLSPETVVDAWMASPTHRKNLLSEKYEDIGIAVVEGDLNGRPTTLVVQLFGTSSSLSTFPTIGQGDSLGSSSSDLSSVLPSRSEAIAMAPSPFTLQRIIALIVVAFMVLVLLLDGFIVRNKGIIRISGRTFAHFTFFISIGLILFLIEKGSIVL